MQNSEKLRQRLCLRLEIFFEFYSEDRSATCIVAGWLPLVYHDPLDSYRKAELQNGQAGPDALRSIGCVKQYHDTIKLTRRSSPLSRKNGSKGGTSLCQNTTQNTPLPRLALPSIEQKLDFVQLVFPPPTPCQAYFDKVNLPLQSYKAYKKFFKEIRVLVLTFGIEPFYLKMKPAFFRFASCLL